MILTKIAQNINTKINLQIKKTASKSAHPFELYGAIDRYTHRQIHIETDLYVCLSDRQTDFDVKFITPLFLVGG